MPYEIERDGGGRYALPRSAMLTKWTVEPEGARYRLVRSFGRTITYIVEDEPEALDALTMTAFTFGSPAQIDSARVALAAALADAIKLHLQDATGADVSSIAVDAGEGPVVTQDGHELARLDFMLYPTARLWVPAGGGAGVVM